MVVIFKDSPAYFLFKAVIGCANPRVCGCLGLVRPPISHEIQNFCSKSIPSYLQTSSSFFYFALLSIVLALDRCLGLLC